MKSKTLFSYPFFWSISFVLLWSILYFIFGEKISVNSGCGYDGRLYCVITQNFDTFILNKSFSAYYANRILPCGIVHFLLKILGFSLTVQNIITGFYVLNTVSWLIAFIFWHKILNYYHISKSIQWLMNILILLNFYFLKLIFYYPVLTDSMAVLFGTMLLWFYIQDKVPYLVVTGFLGAFVYPLFAVYACVLIVFSTHFKLKLPEKQSKTLTDYGITALLVMLFVVFRMYVAYRISYVQSIGFQLNTLLYIALYGYIFHNILPSYTVVKINKPYFISYFIQKSTVRRIAVAILLLLTVTAIKLYLSQQSVMPNPALIHIIKCFAGINFNGALRITEYFSGFGLIAVFFILFIKKITYTSLKQSFGFYFIVLIFCCISNFQKENRALSDIHVFILSATALTLHTLPSIKKYHILLLGLYNLLLSKWYLPIEKSCLFWHTVEQTWVRENFALSTYLMNDVQYIIMIILFLTTSVLIMKLFRVSKN